MYAFVAFLVEGKQDEVENTSTEKSQIELSQKQNDNPDELSRNGQIPNFGSFYDFFHQSNAAEGRILETEDDDRDNDSQPQLSSISKNIPKVPKNTNNNRPYGNVVSGNRWQSATGAFNPYSTFFNGNGFNGFRYQGFFGRK